jgi:osmoprotectant transport system substrate-binding protein
VSRMRTTGLGRATVVMAVAAVAAAGCGSVRKQSPATRPSSNAPTAFRRPGAGKPAVTLGTKNFTEEFLLGQLYAQALRAKGFSVTLKSDIGPSEQVDRELTSGEIDGYPEYTGTILSVFGHNTAQPGSALQAYRLAAGVEQSHGDVVLAMAPATDTDVIVTTPAYASAHRLSSLADLARLGSSATLAGPPEFRTRFSGLIGLKQDYGVSALRFLPLAIGGQYQALADRRAQLAVAFTTDGNLTRGGFVMLSDPKGIFGYQNVTFVVRSRVITREGPAFAQTINAVSAKLSTQALRVMNADVSLDQQSPAAVAQQFLGANGLL